MDLGGGGARVKVKNHPSQEESILFLTEELEPLGEQVTSPSQVTIRGFRASNHRKFSSSLGEILEVAANGPRTQWRWREKQLSSAGRPPETCLKGHNRPAGERHREEKKREKVKWLWRPSKGNTGFSERHRAT